MSKKFKNIAIAIASSDKESRYNNAQRYNLIWYRPMTISTDFDDLMIFFVK